ncbi:helix-turn-helix transcriptional regulator [Streptomyces sp. RFCAC02]|uniref:helix-turn-helix domain-containing protein n=1 Tax=Streptomyces sp. RFCAC02 TaxID=2499143 RepID=UPI00102034E0|nr:helix-turn-helix transcriptional regulator [Streptomyces sp. RFCAC02]
MDGSNDASGATDPHRALGSFLRARRGRVAPEDVGITAGTRRRVRGLRREELAHLAGISVDYYVRLEQGRATAPSPEILDALARALRLDVPERQHLATLAAARRGPAPRATVSPLLRRVLDGLDEFPAFVTNHRLDVVAWNALGTELIGGLADPGRRDRNHARYLFLDPASREVFPDWEERARETVGQLRVFAGRYPDDAELTALIAELADSSADFARMWATGEVIVCVAGRKRLRHPAAGLLHLDYQILRVPAGTGDSGLEIHVFSATEDTPDATALARLAAPAGATAT